MRDDLRPFFRNRETRGPDSASRGRMRVAVHLPSHAGTVHGAALAGVRGASALIRASSRTTKGGLAVLVTAVVCACAGTPAQLPTFDRAELAARGREDYLRSCAPCHGADGRGGARGPDLTRLAETLGPRFSHQYVVDVITGSRDVSAHGPREMPVWEDRFDSVDSGAEAAAALWMQRRIDALATQVESLQVGVAPHDQR